GPSTIASIQAVREADRARTGGRVVRRGRLVRLAVPILESGMEKAVALAESMESRGYARVGPTRGDVVSAWCSLVALLGLGGAFVALVGQARAVAVAAGGAGALALVAAVASASAGTDRPRHRPRRRRTAPSRRASGACGDGAGLARRRLRVSRRPPLAARRRAHGRAGRGGRRRGAVGLGEEHAAPLRQRPRPPRQRRPLPWRR